MKFDKKEFMKGVCPQSVIGALLVSGGLMAARTAKERENQLIQGLVLVVLLYALCYYGYKKTAWAVLLLPFLLILPLIALMLGVAIGTNVPHGNKE